MDSLTQRYASLFWQLHKTHPTAKIAYIKQLLDDTVSFLNNTQNTIDGLHILVNICNGLVSSYVLKLLDNADLMRHTFFIILGRTLEMLLTKTTFISLSKEEEICFSETSNLIVNLCLCENQSLTSFDNNHAVRLAHEEIIQEISYQKVFLAKSFFDKLIRIITDDLAINDYEPYHIKYKVIGSLLGLCTELNSINHDILIEPVVQCLQSEQYIKGYETLDLRESTLNPKQSFFINKCSQFIRIHGYQRQDEISHALCEVMLRYSNSIFEQQLPISFEGAKIRAIGWHIALLNQIALTSSTRIHFVKGPDPTILDQMINILRRESLITSVHQHSESFHADVDLMSSAITLVYNLAFDKTILSMLKENEFDRICDKLHTARDRTIKFASKTLSARLNQGNIDEINGPLNLALNYLFHIENAINVSSLIYRGIKLDGILANLEVFARNDHIKEEIGNDDEGISLFAVCALDHHLDIETIRYPALRIIEAVSFGNENAREKIRENAELMDYIKDLSQASDPTLEPIANRILWKTEDENNFIRKQINQQSESSTKTSDEPVRIDYRWDLPESGKSNKHVLMISYHHSNKDICIQIYDRLTSSNSYQVVFDRDNINEILPNTMADTIEKSSIVLICFSSQYQESFPCRMMAEYAKKRQKFIIGVKLDEAYCPTGWLKNLLTNTHCVECSTSNFNYTCAILVQQINDLSGK